MEMHKDLAQVLITEDEIKEIIKRLARSINEDYKGKPFILVCVLNGAFVFGADLLRVLDQSNNPQIAFIQVSSYGSGTVSTGELKTLKDLEIDISGKNLIIVEDIVDSGLSLSKIKEKLLGQGAESVKICVLLDKVKARKVPVELDYVGMEIDNVFVVGYGLDHNENYRNLSYIGILKPEIYS